MHEPKRERGKRLIWTTAVVIIVGMLLLLAYPVVSEMPGGFADLRMSRTLGMDSTLRIPLGRTPMEAVQKFRNSSERYSIYQEPFQGGMLLFMKQYNSQESSELQVEYVRKTWLGWKWVWGGGYGITGDPKAGIDYMSMPALKGIHTPFPILFGNFSDPAVKKLTVQTGGEGADTYTAALEQGGPGQFIWFVLLPEASRTPYELKALDAGGGKVLAHQTINDARDSGRAAYASE